VTAIAVPIDTLGSTIRAHIERGDAAADKAEQHYKAAGLHLIEARDRLKASGEMTYTAFLSTHCQVGRSRAYELVAIADGKTTLAEVRGKGAERAARHVTTRKSPAVVPSVTNGREIEPPRFNAQNLGAIYYGVAKEWASFMDQDGLEPYQVEALDSFLAEEMTTQDIIEIVKLAAFARIGEFHERNAFGREAPVGEPEWRRHQAEIAA